MSKKVERTFVMIKPGNLDREIIDDILMRFVKKGLRIVKSELTEPNKDKELMEKHYAEHREKDFFEALISYATSGPVISMILEGEDAIAVAREIAGATDPKEAEPGTIRGDYGIDIQRNVVHTSDSEAAARREIALHFKLNH
ncbi:MAG: nucleoside-diphosphate kinase [Methanophagales archaeon]|nr:nucleoside-diphosphate kinase [Methanophagales archaeon]